MYLYNINVPIVCTKLVSFENIYIRISCWDLEGMIFFDKNYNIIISTYFKFYLISNQKSEDFTHKMNYKNKWNQNKIVYNSTSLMTAYI